MSQKRINGGNPQRGSIFVTVLIFIVIAGTASLGILSLSQYHFRHQHARTATQDAFYHAENGMLEGVQLIADYEPEQFNGEYNLLSATTSLASLPYTPGDDLEKLAVKIETSNVGDDHYQVTSTATVGSKSRTVVAIVHKNPPSQVFDYEYFLNNWGWWWGSSIRGYGDQRSNWDFDFRYDPYVYGHVYANGNVEENLRPVDPFDPSQTPFRGSAGTDPLNYCHVGASRISMPNLQDFTYYENKARSADTYGTIKQNGTTLVDAVHGTSGDGRGIYLDGTSQPLEINGTVVVHGDVVIKGSITGQGTLYVGGNLYLANNMTYSNGPDFSVNPGSLDDAAKDSWVDNAVSSDKDLVAFAVRESIYAGKVNTSTWKSRVYSASVYGLQYVGSEANLGEDGIAGTADDGIAYDHDGDGTVDSAWYDADGDGAVDGNYNYDSQIKITDARRNKIDNWPTNSSGSKISYDSLSSDQFTKHEGIFYCNHAFGYNTARGSDYFNGTLICQNEALIFSSGMYFRYDPRVHSRYQRKYFDGDPNRIIDLGLPIAEKVRITDRYEQPSEG